MVLLTSLYLDATLCIGGIEEKEEEEEIILVLSLHKTLLQNQFSSQILSLTNAHQWCCDR